MSDHFPDRLLFAGSLLVAAVAAVVWHLLRQIDQGVTFPAGTPQMTFYLVCVCWLGVSLLTSPLIGRRLRDRSDR